jgi:pimeloyl-ACP methyl ester carboxylesterase
VDHVCRALDALVPTGVRRGETFRDGRALRWVSAGTGGPVVLLDAAAGTTSLDWAPVFSALAACTTVVAYDRAGLGVSDPVEPASRLTPALQVADLVAVLTEAGGGRPCVLVGHSWGATLVQLAVREAPALAAGLVLVDPAHEDFHPRFVGMVEAAGVRTLTLGTTLGLTGSTLRKQAERNARRVTEDADALRLLVDAELTCYAQRHQRRTVLRENSMIGAQTSWLRGRRADSRAPDVPLTVLSATRGLPQGMRSRWTALQADVAATTPQGRHLVVEEAGHYVHHDRPEAVTDAVLRVVELARDAA